MSEKLEKCPFCGGEASIARSIDRVEHDEWVASINCDLCDVSLTPWYTSPSQGEAVSAAIAAWNRRELESASQLGGGEARYAGDLAKAIGLPVGSCNGRRVGFAWDYLIGMVEDMVSYYEREEMRAAPSAGNGGAEGDDN